MRNILTKIRDKLKKSNDINRDSYLWNFIYSTLAACQSAFILMVITRTNGLYDAGVFSLAYAVAGLMVLIGQYGVRRYQSSDIEEIYSFSEYCILRVLTCSIMMMISIVYCVWEYKFGGYSLYKSLVVFLLCILKCIQAVVDLLHGRLQQKYRLDIAGKASSIRSTLETIVCIILILITKNLVISIIAAIITSLLATAVTSVNVLYDYCTKTKIKRVNLKRIKTLMVMCFPLFISTFLSMYIGNAPKYAIDQYLSEQIQAYYNIIFMPAFAINLLASFIFNPVLTEYAKLWNELHMKKMKRMILKQIVLIIGIMLVGVFIAFTIGIPILSLVFGIDMSGYELQLGIVVVGGAMLAFSTFFGMVITIIRRQYILLLGYCIVAMLAKLFAGALVLTYEITGAVMLYAVLMGCLAIFFGSLMYIYINKADKKISG